MVGTNAGVKRLRFLASVVASIGTYLAADLRLPARIIRPPIPLRTANFFTGDPLSKRKLPFHIEVTDEGKVRNIFGFVRGSFKNWRRIGKLPSKIASPVLDKPRLAVY